MLAMTYRGPFRIRVENKPMPEIRHPGDAILRVLRACICGSDLHLYHGLIPDTRVGTTFGHEFVGEIVEIGSGVQKYKVGDRLIVPFNICCGSCYFCSRGLFSNCHNTNPHASVAGGIYGYSATTGNYDGGQAQYVRVPFADVGPYQIPEWMDLDDAVLLTDACPTGYQAAEMGEIKQNDSVLIFGAGPIGIFAAKFAWFFGAGRVVVMDYLDHRLEFVRRFAQCETVNFKELDDPIVWAKKATDYLGFDVCIDAVGCEASGSKLQRILGIKLMMQAGSATAVHWAVNSVRKGGVVSIIGAYGPPYNLFPLGSLMNKGLTIRSNQASVPRYLPRLIDHIKQGRIKPSEVLSHRIPLQEVAEGYHMMASKLDNMIKPVLIPPGIAA